ncbi:glycerophosphodiester phosphodiesterase family protein [Maricaulis sp. CAU 1757]
MASKFIQVAGLSAFAMLCSCAEGAGGVAEMPNWTTLNGEPPLVIAHRGASGERPEHTLAAFRLAIEQGADVIEPDLVMTRDGVLVVRHDRYLSTSTDVSERPEFADRRRTEDGREDWWVDDFTLAELQTLRAVQPRRGRDDQWDGQYPVPTFEAVLDLASEHGVRIEPEVKSPARLAELGLDPLPELVRILRQRGLDGADAPVMVQSFEPRFLARLDAEIDTPLVMLVFPMSQIDPDAPPGQPSVALDDLAAYADGVGPAKALVMTSGGEDTGFVAEAHARGLVVHPWTFRDDDPVSPELDIEAELRRAYEIGVDGVFTDFPATARAVREDY